MQAAVAAACNSGALICKIGTLKIFLPKCLHGSEIMPIFAASKYKRGMKQQPRNKAAYFVPVP